VLISLSLSTGLVSVTTFGTGCGRSLASFGSTVFGRNIGFGAVVLAARAGSEVLHVLGGIVTTRRPGADFSGMPYSLQHSS
jgi:hypothetical protein